jgi:hypothetical protein
VCPTGKNELGCCRRDVRGALHCTEESTCSGGTWCHLPTPPPAPTPLPPPMPPVKACATCNHGGVCPPKDDSPWCTQVPRPPDCGACCFEDAVGALFCRTGDCRTPAYNGSGFGGRWCPPPPPPPPPAPPALRACATCDNGHVCPPKGILKGCCRQDAGAALSCNVPMGGPGDDNCATGTWCVGSPTPPTPAPAPTPVPTFACDTCDNGHVCPVKGFGGGACCFANGGLVCSHSHVEKDTCAHAGGTWCAPP